MEPTATPDPTMVPTNVPAPTMEPVIVVEALPTMLPESGGEWMFWPILGLIGILMISAGKYLLGRLGK